MHAVFFLFAVPPRPARAGLTPSHTGVAADRVEDKNGGAL